MKQTEILNNKVLYGIVTDGIFLVVRKPEEFVLRFSGFGISISMLKKAKEAEAKTVQVYFLAGKKNELYECSIDNYLNSKDTFNYNLPDNENDLRAFVKTSDMRKVSTYDKDLTVKDMNQFERIEVPPIPIQSVEAPKIFKKWNESAIDVNTQHVKGGIE